MSLFSHVRVRQLYFCICNTLPLSVFVNEMWRNAGNLGRKNKVDNDHILKNMFMCNTYYNV